jgi:predicted O-linked N-acetylglucosamine transferase (SPINDLY family)
MPEMTIQQAFDLALQRHREGRLNEAESGYRQILAVDPAHFESLHHLGLIAHQVGRNEIAVDFIRQALALQPDSPAAHSNLGNALRDMGHLDESIAAHRQAIALKPDLPEAHNNLGNALKDGRRFQEAIASYRQALTLKPDYPEAHSNMGSALRDNAQLVEAIAAYRQALALQPDFAEALSNLGIALRDMGQLDESIAACLQAIALQPGYPAAHCNLGNALHEKGQTGEAIAACLQAIALKPDFPEAHNTLGNARKTRGQLDEAIAAYRHALTLKPDYPEAHSNLGNALKDKGQLEEAMAAYREAILLKPDFSEAHSNLGTALKDAGRLDEAVDCFRRALDLNPDHSDFHSNLGIALKDTGQVEEAVDCFRRALDLNPDRPDFHSNLLLTLNYHPGFDTHAIAKEHRRWNRQHAEPLRRFIQPHLNDRTPGRRLRIGYVSPDFKEHAVGQNVLPLVAAHDRGSFEVFCYADVIRPDAVTEQFRVSAQHWRSTVGLTDEQLAAEIRRDRIDVLVDLALHTAKNRLATFARKPAPVQVTFAGYPGSTGLTAIDYRLSDPHLDPPGGDESVYSEQTVRLPHTFWCYDPVDCRDLAVSAPPSLSNGFITFGCLNNFCKINDGVLRLWGKVLQTVPASRLLLLAPEGSHRQHALDVLGQEGIASERIEFVSPQPRRKYLELYRRIDLCLDTLPYNGHTTSLDCFWMGVPVVTLVGQTIVGRAGLSQAMNLDLPGLVAWTPDQYVKIASGLASDLPRLAQLRSTLRQRMESSPLMDAPRFARDIEAAYRGMWRKWCVQSGETLIDGATDDHPAGI